MYCILKTKQASQHSYDSRPEAVVYSLHSTCLTHTYHFASEDGSTTRVVWIDVMIANLPCVVFYASTKQHPLNGIMDSQRWITSLFFHFICVYLKKESG